MLGRDGRRERAQRAEERDAEAGAADERAGEEERCESAAAATTISTIPTDSATDPAAAPAHGAVRPNTSCATAAEPASTKTPTPATRWSVVWNRFAESCGPSERNRPPIDHDEMTPSAASRNGRRTARGTLGRCGVSRRRPRALTGSGIASAR